MCETGTFLAECSFPVILEPVQVPKGYYPIEVVQFWRGEYRPGRPLPLHWSLVVRTSADRGSRHDIVGDMNTYSTEHSFNTPLRYGDDWRGDHVVGYVSPKRVEDLLCRMSFVPVVRHKWGWNCQNWVFEVLEGLRYPDLYADEKLTLGKLQTQMLQLLEAWEAGDI